MGKVNLPVPFCGNDGLCFSLMQFLTQMVGIKGFVGQQGTECEPFDQVRHADNFAALARQQLKANEIAKRVCESENLGGQTAF